MRLLYSLCAVLFTASSLFAQSYPSTFGLQSNSPVCNGQTFRINVQYSVPPSGTAISFRWSGPNSFTSNSNATLQVPASATTAGVYSVTMSFSGPVSGTGTATASTTVSLGTPKPEGYVTSFNQGNRSWSPNYQLCGPGSFSLVAYPDAAWSTNAATYTWTGPNGFSSTEQNPVVAQGTAGLYIVEATYPDGCGTAKDTVTVSNYSPTIFVDTYRIDGNASTFTPSFCPGSSADIRGYISTPTNTTVAYAWSGPNGFTSAAQSFTLTNLTPAMAGAYSVTATLTGACSGTASASRTISVSQPTLTINSTTVEATPYFTSTFCPGGTFRLAASVSANATATYQWSGPNGFASTAQSTTFTNLTSAMTGVYSVTATLTSACSGVLSATQAITIGNPTAYAYSGEANGSGGGTISTFCPGSSFRVVALGGAAYRWSGPNGFTSTAQSTTLTNATASMSGIYSATITFPGGCTGVATTTVTIGPPGLWVRSFTVDNTPVSTGGFCAGSAFQLTVSTLQTGFTPTYQWSGPNGFTGSGQSVTVTNAPAAMGIFYSVTATYTGNCAGTAVEQIYIFTGHRTPVISASNRFTSPNQAVTLQATGCFPGFEQVVWSTGAIGDVLVVSPAQSTTYSAVCRLIGNSCSGNPSNVVSITVSQQPAVDLSLSMQVSNRVPAISQPVTVTLTVSNQSGNSADNVQWQLRLPSSLTIVSTGADVQLSDGSLISVPTVVPAFGAVVYVFSVKPGTEAIYRLATQIIRCDNPDPSSTPNFGTNSGQKYVAWADFRTTATSGPVFVSPEPNPATMPTVQSNEPTIVLDRSELALMLTPSTLTPALNSEFTVWVSVRQRSVMARNSARIRCQLPDGLVFVSSTDFSATGSELTTDTRALAFPHQTTVFMFRVRAVSTEPATIKAEVLSSSLIDPASTPNNGFDTGEKDTAQVSLRVY
ncbi:DUF11 domain-containing protein [Spirosoma montaniterrae]|uniref:PKD/Chitinase domain-containing protein n=1 Tax=Spirosoma montaniterrae TaxID=1178516 RepID=A0A1P9WTP5_9BACT|nr:DUF11 domain-containing protein [Spirosoma montaniterrae]AQG78755.1 hypothetical protein AWR27_05085 [Spirosoma montaniterrae]